MKNLGYANGWKETPKIVRDCLAKLHTPEYTKPNGRYKPLTKVECHQCGYYYHIDSGG